MTKRDAWSRSSLLKKLETLMSDISENRYCAGWYRDLEFWLWEELGKGLGDPTPLHIEDRFLLAQASALLGGWLHWDLSAGKVAFVPYAEWIERYAVYQQAGKKEKRRKRGNSHELL